MLIGCLLAAALCTNGAGVCTSGWRVAALGGAPGLYHDGRAVAPFLFWQWEPVESDTRAMAAAGVDLFAEFGSFGHYAFPFWTRDGFAGMPYQDQHLDRVREWAPEAAFVPRIFTAAPQWWIDAHPDEQVVYTNPGVRPANYKSLTGAIPRESFASELCRQEGGAIYRKAVRHLYDRYGDRLMAVHVAGGPWGEHFSWDALTQSSQPGMLATAGFGDASAPMTRRFRRYLREKYESVGKLREAWKDAAVDFDSAAVPTMEERLRFDPTGKWRDPAKGRKVPDYLACEQLARVEHICHYAGIVTDETAGRIPALAFYGYTQDLSFTVEASHRGTSAMLRRPEVEIFSAPHSYKRRRPGEDGLPRAYLGSVALHGKLFIDEGDDFTYLALKKERVDPRCTASNAFTSVNLLYREFGNAVTRGTGLWYMDLDRGAFAAPELVEAVGRMRKLAEDALTRDRSHISRVAVVSSLDSGYYTAYKTTPGNTERDYLYTEQIGEFCRAGAPFDWYLVEDLDAVEHLGYKVVALLDCEYLSEAAYAKLLDLKRRGTELVFFHAPGYVSENALSWERVRALTGGDTFEPMVPKTAAELRAIYHRAGVHVFVEEDIVLSANDSWLMLHAKQAGVYRVRLPRKVAAVTDAIADRVIATGASDFELPLKAFQTAILRFD